MLYTSLSALMDLFSRIDVKDTRSMAALAVLVKVYHDATCNAPEDIIGVGIVTYAEQALIDFQLFNPEAIQELHDAIESWESNKARLAAEARWKFHDEEDTLDLY